MADAPRSVTQYLSQIETNTKKYLEYFTSQGLPEPSFEKGDGLNPELPLPSHIIAVRDAAVEAADELHHLFLGPLGLLLSSPGDQYLLLSLQYIYRNKIAQHIPEEGVTTYDDIASACELNVTDLKRFVRVATARHVFKEVTIGSVAHTAASKLLVNNHMLEAWILMIAEEFWPSLSRMTDATAKWPSSEEPNETGYSLAHNTNESPFDVIKKDPERQQRFSSAMGYSHLHSTYSMDHLINNFEFGTTDTGIIVDVGGSQGQVSIAIAEKYPNVKCIVQDLPDGIAGFESQLPEHLKGRVSAMEHDFFTTQPINGADIYLFRWILHDWSDKYCVNILRCLIPALKKGAKILINDICIPQPGQLGLTADRSLRLMDISMKAFNNARERDPGDWASLFAQADPRYQLKGITMPPEARMAIVLAEWNGQ